MPSRMLCLGFGAAERGKTQRGAVAYRAERIAERGTVLNRVRRREGTSLHSGSSVMPPPLSAAWAVKQLGLRLLARLG